MYIYIIILQAYTIVTICILIQYIVLLMQKIINKLCDAIVTVYLIHYHIFFTLLPSCYCG